MMCICAEMESSFVSFSNCSMGHVTEHGLKNWLKSEQAEQELNSQLLQQRLHPCSDWPRDVWLAADFQTLSLPLAA